MAWTDKLADFLRLNDGEQAYVGYPQMQVGLTKPRQAGYATGFLEGATGADSMQPKNPITDPNYDQYEQGKNIGEAVGIGAMAVPAYAMALRAGAPKAYNALENYMVKSGGMIPLEAYHGTPHKIEGKFDINKVGTGEGAQAYGHGMYFAENPNVARSYATTGSYETPADYASHFLAESKHDPKAAIDLLKKEAEHFDKVGWEKTDISRDMIPKIEEALKKGEAKSNLYKVDIPDEHIPNMLDYDKPLSQQTPEVQKILKNMGMTVEMTGQDIYKFMPEQMQAQNLNFSKRPTDADVSKYLSEQGIKGIRYLDEGSRGNFQAQTTYKGQPYSDMLSFKTKGQLDDFIKEKEAEGFGVKTFPQTNNFVVFDPSTVKILEESSKPIARKELIQQQIDKIE